MYHYRIDIRNRLQMIQLELSSQSRLKRSTPLLKWQEKLLQKKLINANLFIAVMDSLMNQTFKIILTRI
ncbi:hypothetical protein IHP74_12770 [Enterococcus faecium]|nr:hypothetical protein [Enterococcus faecium]EKU85051.1 hypothetical protein HMPREF9307_02262 [Enterococcus faecium FB129-CNAB4]EGP4907481.1 hypothetical protein [Enterococcus faecium]EIT2811411.1 hypothetical protein [Enterococcus faecium]EME3440284.1 hypothetical protein [Enterococcus faecium]